jgi:hypothetical protein
MDKRTYQCYGGGCGTDCLNGNNTQSCAPGYYCSRPNPTQNGSCVPQLVAGTACTTNDQCASGSCVGIGFGVYICG